MKRRLVALVIGLLAMVVWYRAPRLRPPAPAPSTETAAPTPVETAVPPGAEGVSLLGQALSPLQRSDSASEDAAARLAEARDAAAAAPGQADPLLRLGLALARAGRYREAQETLARGGALHPDDARFPRHRGDVLLRLRRLDEALAALQRALELIDGDEDRPDEASDPGEPVPGATLHFAVWYHTGLAHYLRNELEQASLAFNEAHDVALAEAPRLAATFWQVAVLRRLGLERRTGRVLAALEAESAAAPTYARLLSLFAGDATAEALPDGTAPPFAAEPLLGYGVGLWHFTEGRREQAFRLWEQVAASHGWDDWGVLAAEAELARAGP